MAWRRWLPVVAIWGLLLAVFGLAAVPSPADLGRLAVVVFGIVIVHEAAHAFVGWAAGFDVFALRLGAPVLYRRWVRGRLIELGPLPLGGHVAVATPDPRSWRSRQMAVTAAGSLVNVAIGIIAIPLFVVAPHNPWVFHIAFLSLLVGIANLVPRRVHTPLGRQPNDGRQLWDLLRGRGDAAEAVAHHRLLRALSLVQRGREAEALSVLDEGPTPPDLADQANSLRTAALLRLGEVARAVKLLRPLVSAASNKEEQSIRSNNLAWALLLRDEPGDVEEAVALSEQAMKLNGREPAVRGTHGFALIMAGRSDEGTRLVLASARRAHEPRDRALNMCCAAIGTAASGDGARAREYAEEARRLDPEVLLLPRALAALAEAGVS